VVRQAEHDRQALGGGEGAGEHGRGIALDVLEQQGRALLFLGQLRDVGDFEIPVDFGGDPLQFVGRFALVDKVPQVHRGDSSVGNS
jgi:hypothetical protein